MASKGEEVLRLRGLGLSNKEIAKEMRMPVPSVRRLASEAKKTPCYCAETSTRNCPRHQNLFEDFAASPDIPCCKVPPQPTISQQPRVHLVIPDTQCIPGENLDHMLWVGKYIKEIQPDVVVHLGDNWDNPSLSSYEKPGSKWFEGARYKADTDAGNQGMELISEGMGSFKPKRKIYIEGNHCYRPERVVLDDPRFEGVVGRHNYNAVELGWEYVNYLTPITVDSLTYCHLFQNPSNGRPYSGNVDTMLRNIGFSFVMGHQQGLRWGRRELVNGNVQIGLVCGSYYQHNEPYRSAQATSEWRGVAVLHEVQDGHYDPMFVSLDYLKRKFS